uniref:FBD domain-containing protein n=1 Tax=Triticum urartu TaxID=4572 RepID=A0A8R7V5F6_TRIUA
MVEKVLWLCHYSKVAAGIGLWGLAMVRLETESNALCLWMDCLHSFSFSRTELSLAQEIEKHLVVCNFSVLDLHFNSFKTSGHAFGAFVFRLLAIHRIRTATKILKIGLGEKAIACPVNCPCDEPKNWRSETITLINLEEVKINVFEGQEHEFDFLRQIFKCTPMLKRIAVKLSDDVTASNGLCTKIYDIFKEYPYVECSVVPSSEHSSQSGAST